MVHAYKRNGWLYRSWEFPKIVNAKKDFVCVYLNNTFTLTHDKKTSRFFKSLNTKHAFWFFFNNEWFNILATIKENDVIDYYINIASPFIYEEEAIKYYDLDIDIKMSSSSPKSYNILDIKEFNENKVLFNYEPKLIYQILLTTQKFKNLSFRKKIMKIINIDALNVYIKKIESENN